MKFIRVESHMQGGQSYTTESGMKYLRLPDLEANGFLWYKLPGVERAHDPWACARAHRDFWEAKELDAARGTVRERRRLPDSPLPFFTFVVSVISAAILFLAWVTA